MKKFILFLEKEKSESVKRFTMECDNLEEAISAAFVQFGEIKSLIAIEAGE